MRGFAWDAFTSFVAALAVGVFAMPAGDHAASLTWQVAWPVMFAIAQLARAETRHRSRRSG